MPRLRVDGDAVLALQPLDRDAQMHLALAEQQHLVRVRGDARARSDGSSSISLASAADSFTSSLRSLTPMTDAEAPAAGGAGRLDLRDAAFLAVKRLARVTLLEPAERDRLAGLGGAALRRLLAEHARRRRRRAPPRRRRRARSVPSPNLAGQHAHDRELAAVRGVDRLQHVSRRLGVLELQPLAPCLDVRRLVAQRLQQPQDAVAVLRPSRAAPGRSGPSRSSLARSSKILSRGGWISESSCSISSSSWSASRSSMWKRASFSRSDARPAARSISDWRMLAIDEGALEREIDEAGGDAVLPDRDLPQHQRLRRAPAAASAAMSRTPIRRVDLVQEQEMGNAAILELFEDHLQRRHLLGVGLADDDGGIARRSTRARLVLEFDRAGAVEEGEVVAEEIGVGDIELDAHAVIAGFGRGIADGGLIGECCPGAAMAPVRARMASSNVVLPLRYGPTSAMQRELRPPPASPL